MELLILVPIVIIKLIIDAVKKHRAEVYAKQHVRWK